MSLKIVVMSCDKNQDLFLPFHHCMEKYWKDHSEIIYCTESIINPYYKTICVNMPVEKWTTRVLNVVKQLNCEHILLTIDDLFIRDYVDNNLIMELCHYVKGNIASLNFEFSFDKNDMAVDDKVLMRSTLGKFKLSCMCQIWQREKMLKLFNFPCDPWKFEKLNRYGNYHYLISKNGDFLNWGKRRDDWRWGIVKGKWTKECRDFLNKEGIDIDYDKRGFIEGEKYGTEE